MHQEKEENGKDGLLYGEQHFIEVFIKEDM